jgi:hypothetical protein
MPQWARNHAGQLHRHDLPVPTSVPAAETREETADEAPASPPLMLKR